MHNLISLVKCRPDVKNDNLSFGCYINSQYYDGGRDKWEEKTFRNSLPGETSELKYDIK